MPVLENNGTIRELTAAETIVGSGATATWRLPGVDLAAKHFIVAVGEDGGVSVRSCSTQNVVVVNGRQLGVRPLPLADGDTIAAGSTQFVFARDPAALRAPREPDASPAHLVDDRNRVAFPLDRRSVTIGRDQASIIAVRDPQVSRFHADVRSEAGAYVLYSMGSAGTRVNGHGLAAPRVLESGDKIEIGATTLVFMRGPLPAGVRPTKGEESEDASVWSRRPTVTTGTIDTGETRRLGTKRSPLFMVGLVIAGAVVLVVLIRAIL